MLDRVLNTVLNYVSKIPVGNCMFKFNNRNTRTRCEICLKLNIKTPERRHWRHWDDNIRPHSDVMTSKHCHDITDQRLLYNRVIV